MREMLETAMTAVELVQHVWNTAEVRTTLELLLAERLQQALDSMDQDFGGHD